MNSLPSIDVSNPILYLERIDWKSSSITSSSLSLIISSMLSLPECITHSSSVSQFKLIAIVNWIFYETSIKPWTIFLSLIFWYDFSFLYIKTSNDWSAKHYQQNKERLQKKLVKGIKIFLKKKKTKNNNTFTNNTKI